MTTTLDDLWPGHEQFWIWCDIDRHGEKWRLAIALDDSLIYFPHDHLDVDAHSYLTCPARAISKPMEFGR